MKTAKIKPRAGPTPQWSCELQGPYGILWPTNPENDNEQDDIRRMLLDRWQDSNRDYLEIRAQDLGITAFWVVFNMGTDAMDYFNSAALPQIFLAYHPDNPVLPPHIPKTVNITPVPRSANDEAAVTEPIEQRSDNDESVVREPIESRSANDKTAERQSIEKSSVNNETAQALAKRALEPLKTSAWYLSMASWPPTENFDQYFLPDHRPTQGDFYSVWDDSYGQGQTIYILERGIDDSNSVSLPSLLSVSPPVGRPLF
tara:strand:+ start:13733 stop:14506 length:774 start_codon:yes stop_codon:yes gene_type:complete